MSIIGSFCTFFNPRSRSGILNLRYVKLQVKMQLRFLFEIFIGWRVLLCSLFCLVNLDLGKFAPHPGDSFGVIGSMGSIFYVVAKSRQWSQKIENFNFTQYGCIVLRTDAMLLANVPWCFLAVRLGSNRAKPENCSPFFTSECRLNRTKRSSKTLLSTIYSASDLLT